MGAGRRADRRWARPGDVARQCRRLRLPGEDVSSPAWSPDGRQIAFNETDGISVYDFATGRVQRLLEDQGAGDTSKFDAAWSPSGKRIAYLDGDAETGTISILTLG